MHQQATLPQSAGIATTISGFTNQNGAANPIAFMPPTALSAMQQQQHVAYAQAPFQQQQAAVPSQPQPIPAQQHAPSHQQQTPMEETLKLDNQEPKPHHDELQRINTGHGCPSASAAKPQGYAAAAASTNGTAAYSKQPQPNSESLQDTMASIDDWNAEDAGYTNTGGSEPRNDNRNGYRNGGGRGGFRGGRGDRGGRNNQNGDRGNYSGNGGFRGPERGDRNNGRSEYGSRRGGGRGGGSAERGERGGRGQDRPAVRSDRGKDYRGDKGSSARGRGEGGRGRGTGNNSISNGFTEQKVQ